MGQSSDPTRRQSGFVHADTEARPTAPDELEPGTLLGDYVVDRAHGRGGFGVVYRGHHADSGVPVGLKVLHESLAHTPAILARFEREAQALNEIGHPGIVKILAVGESREGRPYIALEWLDGRDLHDELDVVGHYSLPEALGLMELLGPPLAAAHERGFVHRDLKASNVMVLRGGGGLEVKLLDFGVTKLLGTEGEGDNLTRTGELVGTITNMSPEQILGQPIDARSDIYALGLLLFELLTGEKPYRGATPADIQEQHLHAPAPRASDVTPVSAAVDAVIARCLAKDRRARFSDVAGFLEALRAAASSNQARSVPAAGIFVDARPGDDASDEELDALERALERVRGVVREAGMTLALETQTSLLAVCELEGDQPAGRRAVLERARRLAALIAEETACPVAVVAHAAQAEVSAAGEWLSGPLLDLTALTAGRPASGLAATRALLAGLDVDADLTRL